LIGSHSVEELTSLLIKGNNELFEMITPLKESQLEVSGVQGFRSIKDIIAHLTYWNKHGINWIESLNENKKPEMPMNGNNMEEIRKEQVKINENVHQENQHRPVKEILVEYKETFSLLLDSVNRLDEKHLSHVFFYPWSKEPVTGATIVMWRYWHQENHTKYIKTWLENNSN